MTASTTTRAAVIDPEELAERLSLRRPTAEQAAVIGAPLESALVTAGAGSGKTETMAARVVWLVANGFVAPEQVLGLTFTRKAAGQLADRIRRRLRRLAASPLLDELDPSGDRRLAVRVGEPTVSTYHAYAGRLLAEHGLRLPTDPGARLLSETASWQLAHRVVGSWTADLDTDKVPATITAHVQALAGELGEHLAGPDALRAHAERFCRVAESAPPGPRQKAAIPVALANRIAAQRFRVALLPLVETLAERKRRQRVVDFADQMAGAARLADSHPEVGAIERQAFRAVLLDEYQDTGHAQRVLLRALFAADAGASAATGQGPAARAAAVDTGVPTFVTAVGDPFQSIYGWRGASAANLPRFTTDFPRPDPAGRSGRDPSWVAAGRHELLTSFRNPPEVLALANGVAEPLRRAGVPVAELRPRPGAEPGRVRVALHDDVDAERAWLADAVADRWRAALDAGREPPTSAVLVRRRADMAELAAALRARDLPVEVVGLGGLLDEPEVRDLVSALRLVVDPLAGAAAIRLLTGARWRVGGADLAALWRRARELAAPITTQLARSASSSVDPVTAALPGDHSERAGLVDALDDPGPAARYSSAGYARIRSLGRELSVLRRRITAPLVDLVADVERTLLLDVEAAARPGPVGRAHLDAFADVVADFAAGSVGSAAAEGGGATATSLLAYLETAEEAEDGLAPGEVDAAGDPAAGGARVQVLTVHAAKGLEWELVAVPHVVDKVFPAAKRAGSWLTTIPSLPVPLRGDRADLPALSLDGCTDRKELVEALDEHEAAFDDRRRIEERRLFYVALTRAEHTLLVSGHWWGETGTAPRGPSEFLDEVGALAVGAGAALDRWADPPVEGEENPLAARVRAATWPVDPLGPRRAAVEEGADLVRSARREARDADAEDHADPEGWAADVDVLLAERAAARARHARVLLPPQLSVSQLVDLAADPDALARRLRRPVPRPPNPQARRGTEFHAWLERWFAATELLEFAELPGAADEDLAGAEAGGATGAAALAELQERFTASAWATRTPTAVEVPFETEIEGVLIRGRIDAVFADADGGATVVDWKTGAVPPDAAVPALSVQLAAYRLAWASLSGLPLERVRAALHYVRDDRTISPVDLLDADGLRALVAAVPAIEREPDGDGDGGIDHLGGTPGSTFDDDDRDDADLTDFDTGDPEAR